MPAECNSSGLEEPLDGLDEIFGVGLGPGREAGGDPAGAARANNRAKASDLLFIGDLPVETPL